jgi:hypothetical protein
MEAGRHRGRRHRPLRQLPDRLAAEDGALTADDEAEIVRFEQALGGGRR